MSRDAAPDNASSPHQAGRPVRRALGRLFLRVAGWTIIGDVPSDPKFVAIFAPHTSNWDFVIAVAVMFALDIHARWLGKHTLFWWPLGWLLRGLGGWPVQRDSPQGIVAEVADAIRAEPHFILALAPEGTRRRVDEWHTGFYRIAERAGVPIVPVALDWGRHEITIGDPVHPEGDATRMIEQLRARYRVDMALRPEGF